MAIRSIIVADLARNSPPNGTGKFLDKAGISTQEQGI
jgi:hypothetical protein